MRWVVGGALVLALILGACTLREVVGMRGDMESKPVRVVVQEVTIHVKRANGDVVDVSGKRYEGQSMDDFLADLDRMVEKAKKQ